MRTTTDSTASDAIERALEAARSPRAARAFLSLDPEGARAAARAADRGEVIGPLAGRPVSIKDLFDVVGERTTAGSAVLADAPVAAADAPAVARLRAAGAAFVGRTNTSEFAFSGVGFNPHHGTPVNAALDTGPGPGQHVPGGSTSGGATSVAAGAAWAALGSDTGGSLRIPAALQGLVGWKSTARLVPTAGAVPLSPTLDTVGAITSTVEDAIAVHEVLAARRVGRATTPLAALAVAVPCRLFLDGLDATVGRAFERALGTLAAAGARIEEIDFEPVDALASINAAGGFSAAESWRHHRALLASDGGRYDPRVAARIRRGEAIDDAAYAALVAARADWIARATADLAPYDALLSPTVPIVAPRLAETIADDSAFFAVNGLLLRNPSVVNFLDGCAASLPCHGPGEAPVGLMVWHGAMHDDAVLGACLAIEAALARPAPGAA